MTGTLGLLGTCTSRTLLSILEQIANKQHSTVSYGQIETTSTVRVSNSMDLLKDLSIDKIRNAAEDA